MSIAASFTFNPPRIRCGHVEKLTLPLLGAVEARCWRATDYPGDLCPEHTQRRRATRLLERAATNPEPFPVPGVEYVCPAPTSRFFTCGRTLPCTSHAVHTSTESMVLYGRISMRVPDKKQRRRMVKIARETFDD